MKSIILVLMVIPILGLCPSCALDCGGIEEKLAQDPYNITLISQKCSCLERYPDSSPAIECYKKWADLNESDTIPRKRLLILLFEKGLYCEAWDKCSEIGDCDCLTGEQKNACDQSRDNCLTYKSNGRSHSARDQMISRAAAGVTEMLSQNSG